MVPYTSIYMYCFTSIDIPLCLGMNSLANSCDRDFIVNYRYTTSGEVCILYFDICDIGVANKQKHCDAVDNAASLSLLACMHLDI